MSNKKDEDGKKFIKLLRAHRRDAVLICAFILAGLILALVLILTARAGSSVQVRVDGEIYYEIPLDEDGVYGVTDPETGDHNAFIVSDGKVWMSDASCPDELCIGMGKISRVGQSIVCLPNRVVIEIVGSADADDYDIIVD